MPSSPDQQHDFAAALLDARRPIPFGVVDPEGDPCPLRFAVYRNNVVVGLTQTLGAAFPAVRRLVGEEFFSAVAGVFVRQEPPGSPVLLEYGQSFPAFIERFEPASGVPYLADVARIEWAWIEAYHAEDARALSARSFGNVPQDEYAGMRLLLHPSLRVVRSTMPALTIWRINVGDGEPAEVTLDGEGESALIVRPDTKVEVRLLPPGAADFIEAIATGLTVAEATELAIACDDRFSLSANIAGLIEAGALLAHQTRYGICFDGEGTSE